MTIPGSANPLLLASAAAEPTAYEIERSVRFNSADSAYFSRTPATAGNRKTWTWAGWVKRSGFGAIQALFGNSNGAATNGHALIIFTAAETLNFQATDDNAVNTYILQTSQVFRDPSSWYHIVCTLDTTEVAPSDRASIYVNGVKISAFSTATYPSQDYVGPVNRATPTSIGAHLYTGGLGLLAFNGYLADVHFIDGQALDQYSFGEFDDNGIWQPIEYTGTYGTNGFHLDFADNSTAAALGTDTSGNSNTWTVNNISVAAGAGNDSLVDVPTNGTETDTGVGGEVRGNYCTWNPLKKGSSITLSNGNLDGSQASGGGTNTITLATIGISSGKYYFEVTGTSFSGGTYSAVGIGKVNINPDSGVSTGTYVYYGAGQKEIDNVQSAYGATWTTGDVIGIAFDADNGTLTFYKNGVSQGQAASGLTSGPYLPLVGKAEGALAWSWSCNFGQRPFAYQNTGVDRPSADFKALCTANLDAPLVTKPSTVMDVALDTGANILSATKALCGGNANFLWIKDRVNGSTNHHLIDIVRDPQLDGTPFLASNSTSDEATLGSYSAPSGNSVGWAWYAGPTTDTNNQDGSITSSVRANTSAGFSIVTYTGNGTIGSTVGHGLGAKPALTITKNRSSVANWIVYTDIIDGSLDFLFLDSTNAKADSGSTIPTSTVVYRGSALNNNTLGEDYVMYCFAPVTGYSSFGSYVGNGSSDGPMVYTGMRPRWILFKKSSGTENWRLHDTARSTYNAAQSLLFPNLSNAELTNSEYAVDILSNGFKIRTNVAGSLNDSGATYVYVAFAESPFQYARAR